MSIPAYPTVRASLACSVMLLLGTAAMAVDSDLDGRLDVLDVPQYDPAATGTLVLNGLGIEDLDGVSELSPNLQSLYLGDNQITEIENGDFSGLQTSICTFTEIR